jgi:hypothetical protein
VTDPFRRLLSRLDHDPSPVVSFAELKRWPPGVAAFLMSSGILREIAPATPIVCDECSEGCVIEPDLIEYPPPTGVLGVYFCRREGIGRITIDPAELRQWEPHFEGLSLFVANELDLRSSFMTVVPGHICLLGTLPTGGGMLDVFLARGLACDDAASVIERADRLTASKGPAVIVLEELPAPTLWCGVRPELLVLAEHASWNEAQSRVDLGSLPSVLKTLRPLVQGEAWLTVTEAARLARSDFPHLDLEAMKVRITRAGNTGDIVTNGKTGRARRIERQSLDAWRLQQRNRDLDKENGDN